MLGQARASVASFIPTTSTPSMRRGEVGSELRDLVIADDTIPSEGPVVPTADTAASDPALWLFSGGTTGLPKAVPQSHRSLANTTQLYGRGTLALTADDVTIAVPKLYFGYATGSNLFFPFSVGASTVLFPGPATPAAIAERVERNRASVLVTVPSAINQMLSDPEVAQHDLSSLRLATSAGEALPESLYQRWTTEVGVELLDGLGTAEMWHIFISNKAGEVRPGTLGKVVPGFEVKACDEDGREVPTGEVGRLWVKGESLGPGYWEDPVRTEEAFRGEWFVGGDLISIDEDGYVTHRGRADDALKVKGKWFRPQELESSLLEHESVRECAVVAVTDQDGFDQAGGVRGRRWCERAGPDRLGTSQARGLQAPPPGLFRRCAPSDTPGKGRSCSLEEDGRLTGVSSPPALPASPPGPSSPHRAHACRRRTPGTCP